MKRPDVAGFFVDLAYYCYDWAVYLCLSYPLPFSVGLGIPVVLVARSLALQSGAPTEAVLAIDFLTLAAIVVLGNRLHNFLVTREYQFVHEPQTADIAPERLLS